MRHTKLVLWLGLLSLVGVFSGSCGYRLRGTGGFLPAHIKTISVPMFKNLTSRFELDVKLTQAVINEIVARSRVTILNEPESADAVLSGEITQFAVSPLAFSGKTTADRYQVVVVARVVLRDQAQKKVLFSHPSFQYIEEYEVPEGSDFESMESTALDKVAEKFARSLVITILEGF